TLLAQLQQAGVAQAQASAQQTRAAVLAELARAKQSQEEIASVLRVDTARVTLALDLAAQMWLTAPQLTADARARAAALDEAQANPDLAAKRAALASATQKK